MSTSTWSVARRLIPLRRWFSPPVVVLLGGSLLFATLGLLGFAPWRSWPEPLRWALALMFLLTASARLGHRRKMLEAMVPPRISNPGLVVNVTGVLEAAGAVGLLLPPTAPLAAWCLCGLLLAVFPANVHAARTGSRDTTPLVPRTLHQVLFVTAAVLSAA
jgi:uncharacterized membrane protein